MVGETWGDGGSVCVCVMIVRLVLLSGSYYWKSEKLPLASSVALT